MEIALINNNSLILGPMGFNIRMINGELEDLDLEERVFPQNSTDLPIHFSDNQTHLVPIEKYIPNHDPKYQNIGSFIWEIIKEDNIPIKVLLTYEINNKTLEEVKEFRKKEIAPLRKQKENTTINVLINGVKVEVSTSREERILLSSKISASPGLHKFKFKNTWLEINTEELQYILTEVDKIVQQAYDWEFEKMQEIDNCKTIDDVYDVNLIERKDIVEEGRRRDKKNKLKLKDTEIN